MRFLAAADQRRIEQAVAAAEQRTAAEFVTVVARASGDYLYLPTLAAVVATFVASGVALLVPWPVTFSLGMFFGGQVAMFSAFWLLLQWSPVRFRLVPRAVQRSRAQMRAHQLFLDLGLASTRDRTGVLFFVSVAERYVEIITDRGVREVVEDSAWERTVADFTAAVGAGRIAEGFLNAIASATEVLADRVPRRADDVNELPNRLLIL